MSFWHAHILDTQQYRQDCQAIFGQYLDHYPYFGIDKQSDFNDLESAFEKMQMLYAKEFDGKRIRQVRNVYSKLAAIFKNKLFTRRPQRTIAATQEF
jgi:hypothetical protein